VIFFVQDANRRPKIPVNKKANVRPITLCRRLIRDSFKQSGIFKCRINIPKKDAFEANTDSLQKIASKL
jgi:hypothetical protein